MKLKNILNKAALSVLLASTLGVTSCNYLDVVPPEQVKVDDALETAEGVLGFLYSCYTASLNNNYCDVPYGAYLNDINSCGDDMLNPDAWAADGGNSSMYILYGTLSPSNNWNYWHYNYSAIGQCYLFISKLEEHQERLLNRGLITQAEYDEYHSECQALVAYYHFILLRRYGPIVILTETPDMGIASGSMPGRMHVDYCVDWICDQLDQAAIGLPADRPTASRGRMTSTICKAIKAKVLLLAASPLFNGKFPYDNFKNKNWETPGYGYELISRTEDKSKWERALQATNEAISLAEGAGNRSLYTDNYYETNKPELINDMYIPGGATKEFKEAVARMQYLHYAMEGEGNHEFIFNTDSGGTLFTLWISAHPRNVVQQRGSNNWYSGWSGQNPTLNMVEHFLTKDGYLPENDPNFTDEADWFKSAGLAPNDNPGNGKGQGRDRIINLCMNREPRFYAWVAFDGGNYGTYLANGDPVYLNMIDPTRNGFDRNMRNNSITGFMSMKYQPPTIWKNNDNTSAGTSGFTGSQWTSRAIIRLAELYLNRAECNAMLGNTTAAMEDINVIRRRAGVAELTSAHLAQMPLIDWVKNERMCEFAFEGMRYFDVLRWVEGEKYFGAGKRRGLTANIQSPTPEEFNTPMSVPYNYTFSKKMYLYPIPQNEVYSNPQCVQNPGY